jgi:hypothetical protein
MVRTGKGFGFGLELSHCRCIGRNYDIGMTLTLRDIPVELDVALRKKADEQHMPVDQVAVEAMKAGLGLDKQGSNPIMITNLAAAIRARVAPLGGVELVELVREPMREPPDFGK